MPATKKSRKKRVVVADDEEEEMEALENKRRSRRSSAASALDDNNDGDEGDEGEEEEMEEEENHMSATMMFSQQEPDASQSIPAAKAVERSNLLNLSEEKREKAIGDLTRLILFKSLAGEAIDRAKCIKEAGLSSEDRISSAAFEEADIRLQNQFDFKLTPVPLWMTRFKSMPNKYKDRYYLVNNLEKTGNSSGNHSKHIHSVHESDCAEKAFLMVVLAFTYCKGEPRSDGSRWVLDKDLYHMLHLVDENVPSEPPDAAAGSKRRKSSMTQSSGSSSRFDGGEGVASTPNVDVVLDKFVGRDYLLKEKATNDQIANIANAEEGSLLYSMGPRAALEVGRKQVIYFCAEILREEPDPTMLAELEANPEDEEAL